MDCVREPTMAWEGKYCFAGVHFCRYMMPMHTTRALTDYVKICRNTTWNAMVEVPNVDIARAVYWQPKAQKHDRTSHLTAASHAGSKHVTATLTASSSEEQPAKLSLHSRAEGASASSPAPEGSTVDGSSNAAGSSGSIQAAQPVTEEQGLPVMHRPSSAGGDGGPQAELCPSGPPAKGRTWLKHQVAGHNLLASLAWNEEYLDSAAAYCRVPLSSSLDMASQNRQDGIQYRVGVHHVRTLAQLSDQPTTVISQLLLCANLQGVAHYMMPSIWSNALFGVIR